MTDSSRPRVLVVVGTRPEAIKMAPVVEALQKRDEVDTDLILTGQHSDLVAPILDRFGLRADRDLGIMRPGQTLYDIARGCLDGMRAVVQERSPEALLVQGDTATVAFTSLVGFLERVKVGHVEAGLRSGDKWAPWPEEIFRRLTDVLSDWYFAPTRASAENLRRENVPDAHVHITGNPVVDALRRVTQGHDVEHRVLRSALEARAAGDGLLGVITMHRRESFGAPLREALGAILELAESETDTRWIYPVHPNPQVHGPAHEVLGAHPRIELVEPLDYFDLASALRVADVVLTDSGGIQEEAPSFGTPVLVLREVTERPEGVEAGVAELVGTDAGRITSRARWHLERARAGSARSDAANPYGDGRAGARIADIVVSDLTGAPRTIADWDAPA